MKKLSAEFIEHINVEGEKDNVALYRLSNGAYIGITDHDFVTYFNEERKEIQLPDLTISYDPAP